MWKKKYSLSDFENDKKIRTQVVLTALLKRLIEAKRRATGETLSEYLRKAALLRFLAEENEDQELDTLANLIIGSISLKNHPTWSSKAKVEKWLKKIRGEWKH